MIVSICKSGVALLAIKVLLLAALGGSVAQAAEPGSEAARTIEEGIADATSALHESDFGRAISRLENLEAGNRWEVPFWLGTAYLLDGQLGLFGEAGGVIFFRKVYRQVPPFDRPDAGQQREDARALVDL